MSTNYFAKCLDCQQRDGREAPRVVFDIAELRDDWTRGHEASSGHTRHEHTDEPSWTPRLT